ncbi:MAG TPA: sigma-70 family RNA polymerase sigma factor [Usitatibacter sp.]|nr:sigma-70 family RNA polymerase sigma factor [Usitatibacter sp.]
MLAYAGGDAAAFGALYARHKGPLYRFVARSVRARGEAEELFQDIWMRVIEARVRYAPRAKFTTWLYTIAHHRLVDHWRARGLWLVPIDDDDDPVAEPAAPPDAEPHRIAEAAATLDRLSAALAALPLAQREAFLLHHEGELTVAEIAAATGTHEEAAKSRLRYAMTKLREAIRDE